MRLRPALFVMLCAAALGQAAQAAPQESCVLSPVGDVREGAASLRAISSKHRLPHLMTCQGFSTYYVLVSDVARVKTSAGYCAFRLKYLERVAGYAGVAWQEPASSTWLSRQLERPHSGTAYARAPAADQCPPQTSTAYTVAMDHLSQAEAFRVLAFWSDVSASRSAFDRLATFDPLLRSKVAKMRELVFPTDAGRDAARLSWIQSSDWRFSHLWCLTCGYYELVMTAGEDQVDMNLRFDGESVAIMGVFDTIRD